MLPRRFDRVVRSAFQRPFRPGHIRPCPFSSNVRSWGRWNNGNSLPPRRLPRRKKVAGALLRAPASSLGFVFSGGWRGNRDGKAGTAHPAREDRSVRIQKNLRSSYQAAAVHRGFEQGRGESQRAGDFRMGGVGELVLELGDKFGAFVTRQGNGKSREDSALAHKEMGQ